MAHHLIPQYWKSTIIKCIVMSFTMIDHNWKDRDSSDVDQVPASWHSASYDDRSRTSARSSKITPPTKLLPSEQPPASSRTPCHPITETPFRTHSDWSVPMSYWL